MKSLSRVRLFATLWTYQAPPSMGFSRQEYWSGLPFPSPGDLPNPGIEPRSPALQADAVTSEPPGKPGGSYSKQWLLRGCRRTERSYSTFKLRTGGSEEIPLIQGKEQRLRFAGAAMKRYPMSKVRET